MTKIISSALFAVLISGFIQPAFGFSIADESLKYTTPSVSVCWANYEELMTIKSLKKDFGKKIKNFNLGLISNQTRQQIQNKINEQYSLAQVGFEFTGWKSCTETPNASIMIGAFEKTNYEFNEIDFLKEDFPEGRASLGLSKLQKGKDDSETHIPRLAGEKGFILLRKSADPNLPYPENNFLMVALHEFGHAAGLMHEHNRMEALKDENCLKYMGEKNLMKSLKKRIMGYSYGAYDPQSIMNYCHMMQFQDNWLNSPTKVKLSAGDIHTLRCLYKPENEPSGSCKPYKLHFWLPAK